MKQRFNSGGTENVKETLELIDFVVSMVTAVDSIRNEENPGWGAVLNFIPAITQAPQAFAGLPQIPSELSDRDEEERTLIINRIKQLEIADDHAEKIAETVIEVGIDFYVGIDRIVKAINEGKAALVDL